MGQQAQAEGPAGQLFAPLGGLVGGDGVQQDAALSVVKAQPVARPVGQAKLSGKSGGGEGQGATGDDKAQVMAAKLSLQPRRSRFAANQVLRVVQQQRVAGLQVRLQQGAEDAEVNGGRLQGQQEGVWALGGQLPQQQGFAVAGRRFNEQMAVNERLLHRTQ